MLNARTLLPVLALAVPVAGAVAFLANKSVAPAAAEQAHRTELDRPPPTPPVSSFASPAAMAQAARDAARSVMMNRAEFLTQCWTPAVAKNAQPATSKHILRETFDAKGNEVQRIVEDVPGASREDVGACLRSAPLTLQISPRQQPTTVSVTIAFP